MLKLSSVNPIKKTGKKKYKSWVVVPVNEMLKEFRDTAYAQSSFVKPYWRNENIKLISAACIYELIPGTSGDSWKRTMTRVTV